MAPAKKPRHGRDEILGSGKLLRGDHAAYVVLNRSGARDEQFAGEVVAGDGAEFGGEQAGAVVEAQSLALGCSLAHWGSGPRRRHGVAQFPQVVLAVDLDQHVTAVAGDPAPL